MKLALVGLIAYSAFAYSPDYFPLQVGNQWIYRSTFAGRTSQTTVSVIRTEERTGRQYAVVEGLGPQPLLLRQDDSGTLYMLNSVNADVPWAAFATPEGSDYITVIDPCTAKAHVQSRNAMVETPAGTYPGALQIQYQPSCVDAGLTADWFLPWIGLVRRESNTIAGPRIMELVYSRTSGVTVLSQPEAAFGISINHSAVQLVSGVDPALDVRLTLRVTAEPVVLNYPSGQRFDLAIHNDRGETVFFWSANKSFAALVSRETVGPGERNWADTIPLSGLAPGKYTIEGWLLTGDTKRYTATVGFEILAAR